MYNMHLSLQNGDTPLMVATRLGHDGCMQLLLDRGAQVDHQNKVNAFWDQPRISSLPPHHPPPPVPHLLISISTRPHPYSPPS